VAALDFHIPPPIGRLAMTGVAVALAITVVVTGPARPVTFEIRLPLLVLAVGLAWTAVRWWRGPARRRAPVRMATPWLVLPLTTGVAALTAKGLTSDPALLDALGAIAAACCLAMGYFLFRDRLTVRDARATGTHGSCSPPPGTQR
jgi:hypothetical protein